MAERIGLELAPAAVDVETLADGSLILRSPQPLAPHEASLGEMLRHWAGVRPRATFLAERDASGWRRLCYADALASAECLAQSLLDRGLGAERPLVILSGNSVPHAQMLLAGLLAGIPVAPVSPAYSLLSRRFEKVQYILDLLRPGMVFAAPVGPFAPALRALELHGAEVVALGEPAQGIRITDFGELLRARPGPALERAARSVGPDSVAKYLFTSGSTGMPKCVINTHGMLCANQQMLEQCWPFVKKTPPVLVDWLPWNHTFGGNHNFNLVLKQGGELWIDAGKPAPGAFEATLQNLREIAPSIYFNVPAGYAQLLPRLEADAALRERFFSRLQILFYAAAALPQDLWTRLQELARKARGEPVLLASAWGSTETSPLATNVHFSTDRASNIGLPAPGVEIKLVPRGDRLELRVRGPNVFPGYKGRDDLTAAAFDADGFFKMGDAGRLIDPDEPSLGLEFDGRIAENFKLASGTWVQAGALRVAALAAAAPALQDAVVAGHDRGCIGLLAWLNVEACRGLCDPDAANAEADALAQRPEVIDCVRSGLARHNAQNPRSSTRIERVLLLSEPADIDANEITDKGYINQRAVLDHRRALVGDLYRDPPPAEVIAIDPSKD